MPKHACMRAHTHSHSGFNDAESSVTIFCHAPVLGLPDTAWVSRITISSRKFLSDQDTADPVFPHLHLDENSFYHEQPWSLFWLSHITAQGWDYLDRAARVLWRPPVLLGRWQLVGLLPWWVQGEAAPRLFPFSLGHRWKRTCIIPGRARGVHKTEHWGWGKWFVSTFLNVKAAKSRLDWETSTTAQ